ncbi:MAG: amidohydrolase, partial [Gemmatimonadetes bacterium]|nr:amidohydrolase [Gemmatimonadota bacterium]
MDRLRRLAPLLLVLSACGPDAPPAPPLTDADGPLRALQHGRIWTGTGAPLLEDGTVLVRGGRIVAVGPAASVEVPADAETVDLEGRWVVPGFINAHGHVGDVLGLEGG